MLSQVAKNNGFIVSFGLEPLPYFKRAEGRLTAPLPSLPAASPLGSPGTLSPGARVHSGCHGHGFFSLCPALRNW